MLAWSSHHAERFADNYTVQAKVTQGTPIITVKPDSVAPEEAEGAGTVEVFAANNPR